MSERPPVVVAFNAHARIEPAPAPLGQGETRILHVEELRNHLPPWRGAVHGGRSGRAILSLPDADVVALAAITRRAEIRYLKAARGAATARATVRVDRAAIEEYLARNGRATPLIDVALTSDDGVTVAEMIVE